MAKLTALDAFWLPTADMQIDTREDRFGPGRVPLRLAAFTPDGLRRVLAQLRQNQARALARRPVAEIIAAVDAAARRMLDPTGPFAARTLETLPALTGYSPRMIEIGLERMADGWTEKALLSALTDEFGSPSVLDSFAPRKAGGRWRAFGPALTVHVFSGNIPGVSVTSLIRALCVKSASFGKAAAGEPYLAACFARALSEVDADLASCLALGYWPGGEEELEAVAFDAADAVIAYGSDATIADVRRRLPAGVRFLAYPNRVGAALVAREALTRSQVSGLARAAALDVATFDQQGCVSPHVIYLETGGELSPAEFAGAIAGALRDLAHEIPRGAIDPAESSAIHQLRAQAEMRGAVVLASEAGTDWTVILEERVEFVASPLNRVIQLCQVGDLEEALVALKAVGERLQSVAVAADRARTNELAGRLGALGATRIVSLGGAAWPSPHWHHDGRFQFLDLVRLVDLETG